MEIRQATTPEQLAQARQLFEEYVEWLGIDLSFQGFTTELNALPGAYAPPRGRLLLASVDKAVAGCVALRPLGDGVCEMKRLFVRAEFRGLGLGNRLAQQIVAEARTIGYAAMRLDTLPAMRSARQLYRSLGFVERSAYYETPLEDTIFMELQL